MPTSDDDAASLAETIAVLERRTRELYAGWSEALRHSGNRETAELLERFAREAEEARSACLVRLQAAESRVTTAASTSGLPTPLSPDPDIDNLDPQIATAYEILAAAVRNEDRAFRVLSQVAAIAGRTAPRDLAKAMANLQLARAARLRRHRRNAYRRAQAGNDTGGDLPAPTLVLTEADLVHAACVIEAEAIETLGKVAALRGDLVALLAEIEDSLESLRDRAERLGPPNQDLADACGDLAAQPHGGEATAAGLLADALLASKRAFAFYDAVVAEAVDETLMLLAQSLSEGALARLRALSMEPDR